MLVQLMFEGFEFHPRTSKPGSILHNKCVEESVEIRLDNQFKGNFYCGKDISKGTVMTSNGPQATILIYASDLVVGTGLRAKVRFIEKEETTKNATTNRVGGQDHQVKGFQPLEILANLLGMISSSLNAMRDG